MTLIAAMKNMTPTASMGMSKSSIASSSMSYGMQGANSNAGLLDGLTGCLSNLHVNVNADVDLNLLGCDLLTAHVCVTIN
ncbi:hypothetical protein SAMD00019534_079980 [Acytostelium subglobosum LB1]|uniref:hypothetical protein n=1 Tax=Acytostelium subglobosum LB1 TaxID=1410327 RepID=UPI000644ACF3|nr:hypothetical protein SAMD00019534_079980 [Acytostelium subglobosum LB1]GAM24823.1 hypothetical protein SAMD00019534_079980 [Acytostelium subglobosum LB1]|eukprot:XP_012752492.1 hypothetical protein SAMD00019534_079980 [Acytostelium subglobosum LB1]